MSVAVIGAGAMGGALVEGLVRGGLNADDVCIVEQSAARAQYFADEFGVRAVSLAEAWQRDVVIVAVKPYQIETLLRDATPGDGSVVVSVAAGVTVSQVESALPLGTPVVRIMPNTGSRFGAGMTGVVQGNYASHSHLKRVVNLLDRVGKTLVIAEDKLDALTAISGSGPAYLFYFADAMIEAGVHQGLTRDEAKLLVSQTFLGASAQLAEGTRSAAELREAVTSPGGTTAAALRKLDDHGVRAAVLDAIEACKQRAVDMSEGNR